MLTKPPEFSLSGGVRSSGAGWKRIPVGPLFLSSFILSTLYYAGVLTTWAVLWIDRRSAQFFSSRYLKKDEYPFTVISLLMFIILETLRGLYDAAGYIL